MEEQAAKQTAFFTMAFGGPNDYTGEDLRKAHARLVNVTFYLELKPKYNNIK